VLNLFKELHRSGRTILIVTHDLGVARHCPREIYLRDGKIVTPPELAATATTVGFNIGNEAH
jgi:ABC-type lipoprotein export system ATPase subunit